MYWVLWLKYRKLQFVLQILDFKLKKYEVNMTIYTKGENIRLDVTRKPKTIINC